MFDGLAHLEHEHLAALGERRGLEHELHRLVHAHEEPRHARVRDRDRAAGGDLPCERRDDAAPAAQHVAEPDRAETPAVRASSASTICSPTHFDAPITLTGRTALSVEMNTKRSTPTQAAASTTLRVPTTLVTTASHGMVLEQRHVLVRGGVEDDLGSKRGGRSRTARRVADVGEHLLRLHVENGGGVVQVRLVVVEQDERAGSRLATWRAISRADRPPAPVISTVLPPRARRPRRGR